MPAAEFSGVHLDRGFTFTATVDLANHGAVASVDTVVTVATDVTLQSTDKIVAIPPITLEAGIAVQSCVYTSATTLTMRTTNASAGAINPASASWTFLVLRN
jgi:hypothetical protein